MSLARSFTRPVGHRHVERQLDHVARLPLPVDGKVLTGWRRRDPRGIDPDSRILRPEGDSQSQVELRGFRGRDGDPYLPVSRIAGFLLNSNVTALELRIEFALTVPVEHQTLLVSHQSPLADQSETAGNVDAAAVQFLAARTYLKGDIHGTRRPDSLAPGVIGAPLAGDILCTSKRIEMRCLDHIGNDRLASQLQHIHGHRVVGDRTAGLHPAALVRITSGCLLCRERESVMAIVLYDAPPEIFEGRPVVLVAGHPVETRHRKQDV